VVGVPLVQVLTWVALGLSALALGHAFARAGGIDRPALLALRPFLAAAGVLLLAGLLLTLPGKPPWSPGRTLGPGFVAGGLAIFLAALLPRPRDEADLTAAERGTFLGASGELAAAALGTSVLVLLFQRHVAVPMGGFALGAVTAGLILAGGIRLSGERWSRLSGGIELAVLAAVVLAAATSLAGEYRSPEGYREWEPQPALFAAAAAALLAGRAILAPAGWPRWAGSLVFMLVPLGAIAAVLGYKLHATPQSFRAATIGRGAFLVVGWLDQTDGGREEEPGGRGFVLKADLGLLAALIALGVGILAYRERHGYGMAMASLAGLCVSAAWPRKGGGVPGLLRGAAAFVLLLALYRVHYERTSHDLDTDVLYQLAALVAGALLPAFIGGSVARWMRESAPDGGAMTALARVGLAGLGAALIPLLFWVLMGAEAQAAFLVGLAMGAGLLLAGWRAPGGAAASGDGVEHLLARLVAVGMAWSAIQFTHLLEEPMALRTRTERILLLVAVGAAALVWIAMTAAADRTARAARR
jgi:hypothetical protein